MSRTIVMLLVGVAAAVAGALVIAWAQPMTTDWRHPRETAGAFLVCSGLLVMGWSASQWLAAARPPRPAPLDRPDGFPVLTPTPA